MDVEYYSGAALDIRASRRTRRRRRTATLFGQGAALAPADYDAGTMELHTVEQVSNGEDELAAV